MKMVRTDEWELYDFASNRTETINIIDQQPEIAADLLEKWNAWYTECTGLVYGEEPANQAPAFNLPLPSAPPAIESESYAYYIADLASDPDYEDALSFEKTSGPAWLNVSSNGWISGTPSLNDAGNNLLFVEVRDNGSPAKSATNEFNIAVIPVLATGAFTINPTDDTWVTDGNLGANMGSNEKLRVGQNSARESFLKFEVSGIQGEVLSASLRLFSANVNQTVHCNVIDDLTWNEFSVTYSNRPSMGQRIDSRVFTENSWNAFEVSSHVTEDGVYAFGLEGTSGNKDFHSKEGLNKPELIVLYANMTPNFDSEFIVKPNATVGQTYSETLATNLVYYGAGPLSFTKVSGPDWLSVSDEGGLAGEPGAGHVGVNEFVVRVSDTEGRFGTTTLSITTEEDPDAPSMNTLSLLPVADTWVTIEKPLANLGSDSRLRVGADAKRESFLKFSVDTGGASISSATLRLYSLNVNQVVHCKAVETTDWEESSLNYSNRPSMGATLDSADVVSESWHAFDVGSHVTTDGIYAFGLEGTGRNKDFMSRENANPPELIVTYTAISTLEFTADSYVLPSGSEGRPYSASIATNVAHDGGTLEFAKVDGPEWIEVSSDGLLTGVPTSFDIGLNQITIEVANETGVRDEAVVTIEIAQAPEPDPDTPLLISPSADTWVTRDTPNANMGDNEKLRVGKDAARESFLKFDVTEVDGNIASAVLRLYSLNVSQTVHCNALIDTTWAEYGVTYSNRPSMGTTLDSVAVEPEGWYEFDVTAWVTNNGVFALGLEGTQSNKDFESREGVNAPELIILQSSESLRFDADLIYPPFAESDLPFAWDLSPSAEYSGSAPLTFAKIEGPQWLQVSTDGVLSGTPSEIDAGLNIVTIEVSDGVLSATTTLMIEVIQPQQIADDSNTLEFLPSDDAWVSISTPIANQGDHEKLRVGKNGVRESFLKFDVAGVPESVTSAILRVYSLDVEQLVHCKVVEDDTWEESTVTYSNRPAMGATLSSTDIIPAAWNSFDVTSHVIGNGIYAFGLAGTASNKDFESKEGINQPFLEIRYDPGSALEGPRADYAYSQTTTHGLANGDSTALEFNDDDHFLLTETWDGSTYQLDHTWTFDVTGDELVTSYVEAHHDAAFENESFILSYSTNGTEFIDMLTVVKTMDDDTARFYSLPSGLQGTVFIHARDSGRMDGETVANTLYVDSLFIVSESAVAAPLMAEAPVPSDGEVDVDPLATLSWSAGLMSASHDIYFGTNPTPAFAENRIGATFAPGPLLAGSTYYWSITELNSIGSAPGPVWSFSTASAGIDTSAYIEQRNVDLKDSRSTTNVFFTFEYKTIDGAKNPAYAKWYDNKHLGNVGPIKTIYPEMHDILHNSSRGFGYEQAQKLVRFAMEHDVAHGDSGFMGTELITLTDEHALIRIYNGRVHNELPVYDEVLFGSNNEEHNPIADAIAR